MNAAQEPSDDDIEAEASRVFPWAFPPDSDRERLIAVVDAHPRYWTASKLADRFEITFDEKVDPDLRIHHIPCFDRPKHQVDAFLKQRQRDRDAEQKRLHWKFEKKKPKTHDFSPRTGVVLAWLQADGGWSHIEHIVNGFGLGIERVLGVGTMPEFEGLAHRSKRKDVLRAVHELAKTGVVGLNAGHSHYQGTFKYPILFVRILRGEAPEA
jgi:hypothetical protein